MPQALPVAAAYIAGVAANAATGMALSVAIHSLATTAFVIGSAAGSLIVGSVQARHQQNLAQSKARAAYEAAQTDRALMVRNPIQPRRVIYGENVVSGVMAYVGTHGHAQYNDYLRLVLVLAGHELDSISEIRIDDHVVQDWTGDDWAHDARFCKGLEADSRPLSCRSMAKMRP